MNMYDSIYLSNVSSFSLSLYRTLRLESDELEEMSVSFLLFPENRKAKTQCQINELKNKTIILPFLVANIKITFDFKRILL